jgi:NAD(P)-dependent dehydrogenase (short-subunit alcohol dehydrogenase family)
MIDLKKGAAVVTGAGTGLGRALAIELARQGVQVAGFGRRAELLAETSKLAGPRFTPVRLDVGDPDAVKAGMDVVSRALGSVSLLINNAAVYPRLDFLDETPESFMQSVAINLGGVAACSHAALGQMVEKGYGRILNVSTFADLAPIPASSAYSVSKGAARILTRALVADICDRFPDIVINDWMPGSLATDMGIAEGLDPALAARWGVSLALWHDRSLTGTVWERDTEQLPMRSLKGRVKDALLMRKRKPRILK